MDGSIRGGGYRGRGSRGRGRGRGRKTEDHSEGYGTTNRQFNSHVGRERREAREAYTAGGKSGSQQDASGTLSTTGGWVHTTGDVAFKDTILPAQQRRISRVALDAQLVKSACTPWSDVPTVHKVVPLSRIACRLLAEHLHKPPVLDALSEGLLPPRFLLPLFHMMRRVYSSSAKEIPFFVWKRILQTYGSDVHAACRVYNGIVVDDISELQKLHTFDAPFSFTPCHNIMTLLDVSDTAFSRDDLRRMRSLLSSSLSALRLGNLVSIDDDAIKDLAREAIDGDTFPFLEILSLKGCWKVTDRSANRLANFRRLQMLGKFSQSPA